MTEPAGRQRIDKWLWHARVVRTRTAAAALASSGHVRLNGARVDAASQPVRLGDVLTVALDRRVRVLKVLDLAERRGSAANTIGLYEEIGEPVPPRSPAMGTRAPGSGRPTKWERRKIERFTGRDNPEW